MNYNDIQKQLTTKIEGLQKKLDEKNLTDLESKEIANMIDNYQYISELAEMNHFFRG